MFRLEGHFVQEMVAHARAETPNECCGILAGPPGKVAALYRTANASASPERYKVDDQQLGRIIYEMPGDWDILGIYHSHTHTQAYPSPTDMEKAGLWPDTLFIIISLADPQQPVIRGFYLRDGQVTEEELEIA
jgi:proteasome lid subunit RPN8/RPN11